MSFLDDVTAEQLVTIVQAELIDRDMEGVEAAMRLLALKDPHRAEEVLATLHVGLALHTATGTNRPTEER
jgi:hypothetical protein